MRSDAAVPDRGPLAEAAEAVEDAREALVAAAPRGRGQGAPLAEALAAFDLHLRRAATALEGPSPDGLEDTWARCRQAVAESGAAAERLRTGEPPQGYEQLYGPLAEILEPLDAVVEAAGG